MNSEGVQGIPYLATADRSEVEGSGKPMLAKLASWEALNLSVYAENKVIDHRSPFQGWVACLTLRASEDKNLARLTTLQPLTLSPPPGGVQVSSPSGSSRNRSPPLKDPRVMV